MPTLNWIGKEKVVSHHLKMSFYTLELQYGFSGEDGADRGEVQKGGASQKEACQSKNMIIHGDNLLALKALMTELEGRENCIYTLRQ